MRKPFRLSLRVTTLLLFIAALLLIPACALGSDLTTLNCAIVATKDLRLRPLELNQRDVVSVLDLVYEGLFSIDDTSRSRSSPTRTSSQTKAASSRWCCATTSPSTTARS